MKQAMMLCLECGRSCEWNPVGYCSWDCFDAEQREGAPEAFAYFFGLGVPEPVDDEREA